MGGPEDRTDLAAHCTPPSLGPASPLATSAVLPDEAGPPRLDVNPASDKEETEAGALDVEPALAELDSTAVVADEVTPAEDEFPGDAELASDMLCADDMATVDEDPATEAPLADADEGDEADPAEEASDADESTDLDDDVVPTTEEEEGPYNEETVPDVD